MSHLHLNSTPDILHHAQVVSVLMSISISCIHSISYKDMYIVAYPNFLHFCQTCSHTVFYWFAFGFMKLHVALIILNQTQTQVFNREKKLPDHLTDSCKPAAVQGCQLRSSHGFFPPTFQTHFVQLIEPSYTYRSL